MNCIECSRKIIEEHEYWYEFVVCKLITGRRLVIHLCQECSKQHRVFKKYYDRYNKEIERHGETENVINKVVMV